MVVLDSRMWTIQQQSGDRLTRRSLLRVGGLALGGLTLGVLRSRAESPGRSATRPKSVIMIHLSGGPSHLDMYDMKPEAPAEYRGEFRPIRTNVPGIDICELMPKQSKIADKFAILRGVQLAHLHTANEFYSGYPWQESPRASVPGEARRPALGSIVSKCRGGNRAIPPYVSLDNKPDWEEPYYVGPNTGRSAGSRSSGEPLRTFAGTGVTADRLESRQTCCAPTPGRPDDKGTMTGIDAVRARHDRVARSDT